MPALSSPSPSCPPTAGSARSHNTGDNLGIISRQAIRCGTFTSVKDLIAAIGTFIDGWNERCQPFVWTKTADEILRRAKPRKDTSFTRH